MNQDVRVSLAPNFPYREGKDAWPWRSRPYSAPFLPAKLPLPKISVITPSYNQGRYIEETIRSVLLQDYPNLEYIVIDGGSTDDSPGIIKRYAPWLAYWVSEADKGQSQAINKGMEKATGDWVAWLNTDDIYLPGALWQVAATILQAPEPLSWVVGATIHTDSELREVDEFKPHLYTAPGRDMSYAPMGWLDFVCTKRSGIALPQPSSFWRRDAVMRAGGINESMRYAMDHELYGRLAYHAFRPVLIEQALACFRAHEGQKTADFPVAFWQEELEIVYNWASRVNAADKQKLERYGAWLARQIKFYPYRSFLKKMLRPPYRRLKKLFQQ